MAFLKNAARKSASKYFAYQFPDSPIRAMANFASPDRRNFGVVIASDFGLAVNDTSIKGQQQLIALPYQEMIEMAWDGRACELTFRGPSYYVMIDDGDLKDVVDVVRAVITDGNKDEIAELQQQYAQLVSQGATLPTHFAAIDRIYGLLRDQSADADQRIVDEAKGRNISLLRSNPSLYYHEPHLDRERFDSERPDRRQE